MASEQGYGVRTAPSAGPGPVLADPRDFGAQLGQALDQFGQVKHQGEVRAYQIERQQTAASEQATFASNFAKFRQSMDGVVQQTRGNAAPGAAGHPDAIKTVYETGRDALLASITEDRVRQQAAAQFDEYGASLQSRESLWAEGKRVAKLVTDTGDLIDTGANRIRTSVHDQGAYADELKFGQDAIAAMQGIDDDTKAKLQRQMQQSYTASFVQGLFDKGQAKTARGLLESGAFDHALEPAQKEALMNGADVEVRRIDAQQQQENAAALAGAKEKAATLQAKAGNVPLSEAEIAQAAALRDQFKAIGDTSTAEQLQDTIASNVFAREFEGQLPIQMQQRLSQIRGKANLTDEEKRLAAWLPGQISARSEMFRADSKSFFMQYGTPSQVPPPFDITDPGSVAATVQWARARKRETGADVALLTREQAEQLAGQARKGGQQRMEVLGLMDRIPDQERDAVAQQLMPGDAGFRQEAQLHPEARTFVFEGRDVLKANPRFMTPDKETGQVAAGLLGIMGREMKLALSEVGEAEKTAMLRSSGEWLAGWLSKHGRDVNSLTPWDIRQAATFALGGGFERGTRQKGGIVHARDGQPFVLPDTMSDLDFYHNVERDRAAKAAKGAGPSMSLQNAHPVWMGRDATGDHYRWETTPPPGAGSGPRTVVDVKGDMYVTTVRAGR